MGGGDGDSLREDCDPATAPSIEGRNQQAMRNMWFLVLSTRRGLRDNGETQLKSAVYPSRCQKARNASLDSHQRRLL